MDMKMDAGLDLTLTRHIRAVPERVFAAWTRPDLLVRWFSPKPVETVAAEVDLRVGGTSRIVMRLPDGTEAPHEGVYLEVEPGRRLVMTSCLGRGWRPVAPPEPGGCHLPLTIELVFQPEAGGTRYTAVVRHATAADRAAHEAMGFHAGWGQCADQLAALVEGMHAVKCPPMPAARQVTPYLNFDGRCAEALEFYRTAIGAQVEVLTRFKDAPPPPAGEPEVGCPGADPEMVMHASFRVGTTVLMASDCQGAGRPSFAGVSLSLSVWSEEEAQQAFAALGVGGVVVMALGPTFWSDAFGVVQDRFGLTWMINLVPFRH